MFAKIFLLSCLCGATAAAGDKIDSGADKVNSLAPTASAQVGGAEDYDYLALRNHIGPSGVPLGGIGVGYFCYCPDGRFTRVAINGWHDEGHWEWSPIIKNTRGTFLALWADGQARLLQRGESYLGMAPAHDTVYRGLFPTAECRVDEDAVVKAWSPLVPQNVGDSSLPLAWIEVTLKNPQPGPRDMAAAFSWEDVIGRQISDVPDARFLNDPRFPNTAWGRRDMQIKLLHGHYSRMPRVPTTAEPASFGAFQGVRQWSQPLRPIMKTFQNYNNEVAILAEQTAGAQVTLLPAYRVADGEEAWDGFRREGRFSPSNQQPLHDPRIEAEMASAVAVRTRVAAGQSKTVRFLVAWFRPEIAVDPVHDQPGTFFGKADYNRYYHNRFSTLAALVEYAGAQRERLEAETRQWQLPILQSTYPDWLKFKVINSAYTLFTNTILNKAGDFTVMEGGMGGLAGTMDQRISAHPFYFKFFTALDRADLELFGHTPGKEGQILHFDGHYYLGLASRDGATPVPDNAMNDNTGGWLVQLAKDYQQSGDAAWLGQFEGEIRGGLKYLRSRIQSKEFQIITGSTSYDDFWHPPLYAYNATTYPTFLQAGAILLDALGDAAGARECRAQAAAAAGDALRALWNGRYFAYGADLDGGHRRDDILFSGQLAGPFLSRYCGWEDIFSPDTVRSSVVAQLTTNIAHSPDYYAPKVWLLQENRAMNDPRKPANAHADSTCWPFYLESYTAMAAIQAGYVDDGLEIMRHLQLVHLRNGWTWSQDLWRPGELTYVCAPVSWFITDVLAGSALDLPNHSLELAPVIRKGDHHVALPLFFPRFWAMVEADRARRSLTFTITKVFDGPEITLEQIIARPVGSEESARRVVKIPPFKVRPEAVLDLSADWDALTAARIMDPVLPRPVDTHTSSSAERP